MRRQLDQAIASISSAVKPRGAQLVEEAGDAGDVAEGVGDLGAVEVGAEGDVGDADAVGDVADVAGDQVEADAGGVVLTVGAEEGGGVDDPDQAAALRRPRRSGRR